MANAQEAWTILLRFVFTIGVLSIGCVAAAFDLSGTVILSGETQEPVRGANVWLSQDRVVRMTKTDDAGRFAFSGVTGRPVNLVAHKPGWAIGGYSALGVVDSGSVTITLGTPDDLRLRIVDETFGPVAGARIRSMVVNDTFCVDVDELVEAGFPSVRSQEDGLLTVSYLPSGAHVEFSVYHHKFAESHIPYLPVGRDDVQDIPLRPGVVLPGRVTNKAEQPVPAARVSLFRVIDNRQRVFAEAVTDRDGFYKLVVRPGDYYVAVFHPEYPTPKPQAVQAHEEGAPEPADFVLPTPRSVTGRVVYGDNVPAPAVRVAYLSENVVYTETFTHTDGHFELKVGPGQGAVRIMPPTGYITENVGDIAVTIGEGAGVNLEKPVRLKPLPEIAGTVVDDRAEPQPNCLISSLDLEPPYWAITDAEGRFRVQLYEMPPKDKALFRAEHATRFLRRDFKVKLDDPDPATIKLRRFDPDLRPCADLGPRNDLSRKINEPAPVIYCDAWFNSGPVALEDLKGKVVVMTLWAGFDQHLGKQRMAELNMLYRLFADADDVFFLAIHEASAEQEEVKAYIREFGIQYAVGLDADPFITFEVYQTNFIPQTVLIDKKGLVRFYHVEGRLLELIKQLRLEE